MKRTYRANNSLKIFFLIFLALSLLFSFGVWRGIAAGTNTWTELCIGFVLAVAGASCALQAFTVNVELSDESIRYGSVFGSQSLERNQISYRREYEEYQSDAEGNILVGYLELIPNAGETSLIRIQKDNFTFDQAFWEWIMQIPER